MSTDWSAVPLADTHLKRKKLAVSKTIADLVADPGSGSAPEYRHCRYSGADSKPGRCKVVATPVSWRMGLAAAIADPDLSFLAKVLDRLDFG